MLRIADLVLFDKYVEDDRELDTTDLVVELLLVGLAELSLSDCDRDNWKKVLSNYNTCFKKNGIAQNYVLEASLKSM